MQNSNYNERLFSGGMRSRLHLARFYWLRESLDLLNCRPGSVLELGCFDGKTLQFIQQKPDIYLGFDANWEGGLDLARNTWQSYPQYRFVECNRPDDFFTDDIFDISVCMETLEHLPEDTIDSYLEKLAEHTRYYSFITFPNENGLLFAAKHLLKRLLRLSPEHYSLREFLYATFGKMDQIERNEHKGFDYRRMIRQISRQFEIISIMPIPFKWLPLSLGFDICVIARPKNTGI